MSIPFKKYISDIKHYEPGKPIKELEREYGIKNIIKLASNENPLGTSKKAIRAIKRALSDINLYPEGSCHYLLEKLSNTLKIDKEKIICGNGSNEIIELLARGFLSEGDEVISSEKTFLVYPILTQACGTAYKEVPMTTDYRFDFEGILRAITPKTKIIFIVNPNNPTGTYLNAAEIEGFIAKVPKNILICIDEAYVDFANAPDFPKSLQYITDQNPNVVLLRTFSKAYGLAGLRIGYGVASKEIVGYLHKVRQPFNVNSLAQTAAVAAIDDAFFLWRAKRVTIVGREFFYKQFKKMGLEYLPSQANFVLVNMKRNGREIYQALLKQGMIVRPMNAYNLPNWLRVTIGKRGQNVRFIKLLKEYLGANPKN